MPGITLSPLNAVAGSDNALMIQVAPAAGALIDAIRVTASGPVGNLDSQWVLFGLPLPIGFHIKAVRICYLVEGAGTITSIAQTRLSKMSTPDHATVIVDDGTHRNSTKPVCYQVHGGGAPVTETITLALRVEFEDSAHAIRIGGITILD